MAGYAWPSGYSTSSSSSNPSSYYSQQQDEHDRYIQQRQQQQEEDDRRHHHHQQQQRHHHLQQEQRGAGAAAGGYYSSSAPPIDYYPSSSSSSGRRYDQQPSTQDSNNSELNEFRAYFDYQLSTLTFNSRPIINNLSLLARDRPAMASVIAKALEHHLRTCPTNVALPALYLLDSIAKNTGPPYLALFALFIESTFLSLYHSADAHTRTKMEELLGTWRTGGANRGELFRLEREGEGERGRIQEGIERGVFGAGGRGGGMADGGRGIYDSDSYMSGVKQLPATAAPAERAEVLFEVRRMLQLRNDQALVDPDDLGNERQIGALQQLESLILTTQLTSDQVFQIRGQLALIAPPPPAPLSPSITQYQQKQQEERLRTERQASAHMMELAASLEPLPAPSSPSSPTLLPTSRSASLSLAPISPTSQSAPAFIQPKIERLSSPALPLSVPFAQPLPLPSAVVAATAPPVMSVINGNALGALAGIDPALLAQLQGLAGSGRLGELLAAAPNAAIKREGSAPPPLAAAVASDGMRAAGARNEYDPLEGEFDRALMDLNIELTNLDLLVARSTAPTFLYSRLNSQCNQCGLRFFDSAPGKAKMDVHLDWHFTHKRRIREGAGRAQGRGWFLAEDEWYRPDAASLDDSNDLTSSSSATARLKLESAQKIDRAELMKRKVIAPTDTKKLAKGCPICREKFKSEWSDEEEDWVFYNALSIDGTIYHATCHAEAINARLASTRLRTDSSRPSRESTPLPPRTARDDSPAVDGNTARKKRLAVDADGEEAVEKDEDKLAQSIDNDGEPDGKRVKLESDAVEVADQNEIDGASDATLVVKEEKI